jgi:hypothetical protein
VLSESLLEGGGEIGELAAAGEEILVGDVGGGDGAVDGTAGADRVDDLLLLGSECGLCRGNLILTKG